MITHNLGFPRIGVKRELKRAIESYWKSELTEEELRSKTKDLRKQNWQLQKENGIDLVPVGDFSLYDQMLDMTTTLGAVPKRFGSKGETVEINTYFDMARGKGSAGAMEMTKWFDTNYHYIVPEFESNQTFKLSSEKIFEEVKEAIDEGYQAKPVLVGPLTYLFLGKETEEGFNRFEHLNQILKVYEEILTRLKDSCEWIQLDEPILVLDLGKKVKEYFKEAYEKLTKAAGQMKILLATYFGELGSNEDLALSLPVKGLHLDLVRAPEQLDSVLKNIDSDKILSLGVVNGRNIWKTNLATSISTVKKATEEIGKERIMIAPSCSLLHVPVDLDEETALNPEIKNWMAFAKQKCKELQIIRDSVLGGDTSVELKANENALKSRKESPLVTNKSVQEKLQNISKEMLTRKSPFPERIKKQNENLKLPLLPTTTIGSFPQTKEIRKVRSEFKKGKIVEEDYKDSMKSFIKEVVDKQEELSLDVLVHGEPERNDMVEYFGEQLSGYCFTKNGWVQSYGTRCVKPPVLFGDVIRPESMTVNWIKYAQSLTDKPMKGMLTGPVTILCWSFVRDDQPRSVTCKQIALALREEVKDLEEAGIKITQVDEPAIREGLPLRKKDWKDYLQWAIDCFRLTTSGVKDETQIHTHMCYSEFNDIIEWIAKMDADVISIEASRSKMELLKAFQDFRYPNEIGPGVYDIHSPRIPSKEEIKDLIKKAIEVIPLKNLWVNPDCGLKTRNWEEVIPSLRNMVEAARELRKAVNQL
ncbi:5-methyltetrahydropteroyltriglutamate--homocysteine S-methyltransferase [candidate division WOR-3 bacterium]|nr:5-methyltetrahydropteroyltriglutamate--homocysteine S-methyltransferase [candidate division WOR-3 bacterium]